MHFTLYAVTGSPKPEKAAAKLLDLVVFSPPVHVGEFLQARVFCTNNFSRCEVRKFCTIAMEISLTILVFQLVSASVFGTIIFISVDGEHISHTFVLLDFWPYFIGEIVFWFKTKECRLNDVFYACRRWKNRNEWINSL